MRLLVHESIYWIGINVDIENHIKSCLRLSQIPANAAEGEIEVLVRPWEVLLQVCFPM